MQTVLEFLNLFAETKTKHRQWVTWCIPLSIQIFAKKFIRNEHVYRSIALFVCLSFFSFLLFFSINLSHFNEINFCYWNTKLQAMSSTPLLINRIHFEFFKFSLRTEIGERIYFPEKNSPEKLKQFYREKKDSNKGMCDAVSSFKACHTVFGGTLPQEAVHKGRLQERGSSTLKQIHFAF